MMSIVTEAAAAGRILGVQLPPADEDDEPWAALPSRRHREPPIEGPLPKSVEIVLGNQVYIKRSELPPGLVNRIARLAAFQNPEFYAAQAMRLPTFGKPRVIACAELFSKHVALPRGCLGGLMGLLGNVGITTELRDERQQGQLLTARFLGELTPEQSAAAAALLKHETASDRRVGSSAVQHAIDGFEGRSTASKANATNERSRVVKTVTRRAFACGVALLPSFHFTAVRAQTDVSPAEARTIAKEAYIYGFPIVDSYRIQHAYFVDTKNPEYKGPWNQLFNTAHVFTPADTAIQTPNSDTPYSFVGMDLHSE